jgi:hypothetical protein
MITTLLSPRCKCHKCPSNTLAKGWRGKIVVIHVPNADWPLIACYISLGKKLVKVEDARAFTKHSIDTRCLAIMTDGWLAENDYHLARDREEYITEPFVRAK